MYFLYTLKALKVILDKIKDKIKQKQKTNSFDHFITNNLDYSILVFSNEYLIQNFYNFINFVNNQKNNGKLNSIFLNYLKKKINIEKLLVFNEFVINLPILTYHNLNNLQYILQNLFDKNDVKLKKIINIGDKYILEEFINLLESFGYIKSNFISQYFEYNTRGNIIDVFPYLSDYPVRIEFEDEYIESIRYFDKDEFISIKKINSFVLTKKQENDSIYILDLFVYFKDKISFITDLSQDLFKNRLYFILKNEYNLELDIIKDFIDNVKIFYIKDFINNFNNLPSLALKQSILSEYIKNKFKDYTIILISDILEDFLEFNQDIFNSIYGLKIEIIKELKLFGGFVDEIEKIVVITEADVKGLFFNDFSNKNIKRDFIIDIDKFEEGDLVVVDNLGIGIYLGIKNVEIKPGMHKDMALVLFKNNKKVYLNIENVNIHRYIASREVSQALKEKILSRPSLSEWNKKIRDLYLQTKDLADAILKINANRLKVKGFSFFKTELEEKVAKDFIYQETKDQLKAIEEVLKDLESQTPSNRLLIGDTGYGKTEVLIRAIARVIGNKYKVLFIVPSTVLAYQHYNTFFNRFNKYLPNSVKLYCSIEKDSHKNLKDFIENDNALLLVSTNLDLDKLKPISNEYSKIGLVIIDEEHLLGLLFKEKIKEIFIKSHLLMVSATPIPRTLFLSINSLIDTTIISTPPSNYKPPFVFLLYFKDRKNAYDIILSLILKHLFNTKDYQESKYHNNEYYKNQIYYVNNKIDELYLLYRYLLEYFDKNNIKVRMNILHSKLPKKMIEKIFIDFINKKYDLILSTTLIQSGLDNPYCQVMIIDNSHLLGLSQIYQLRGRVSRQGTQGYCYILFPEELVNTKTFERISFFEKENISNYEVVLKDLEMRGPGTLLSKKQSGFIDKIGIIQYLKLLSNYVNNQNNLSLPEIVSDLPMYLDDSPYKNILYRKLILANTLEQFEEIKNQILDIYGKKLSQNAKNLLFAIYNRIKYKGKAKRIIISKKNELGYELHIE
jgi:transcription-repair coupling factor (superfamily II helicase)